MRYLHFKLSVYLLILFTFTYADPVLYVHWDNNTPANFEDLEKDPFLAIRTKVGALDDPYDIVYSWKNFAEMQNDVEEFEAIEEELLSEELVNEPLYVFDHCPIVLPLPSVSHQKNKIWWQISHDSQFRHLIPNFNQIQTDINTVTLSLIDETFINPRQIYYFRYCSEENGIWSAWSQVSTFQKLKVDKIEEPLFEKIGTKRFKIFWEKNPDPDVRYLVFASNSRDFVPSIYYDKQLQYFSENELPVFIPNYNFLFATHSCSIEVDGQAAYYRIIVEKQGDYSIPSSLIYVYDTQISSIPDILKLDLTSACFCRQPISPSSLELKDRFLSYLKNPHVPSHIWEEVSPYFLPKNHPIKAKLDQMFKKKRVTLNSATIEKAGFEKPKPRPCSFTIVSKNEKMKGYIFKFFSDEQTDIDDWIKLTNRINGAKKTKEVIQKYHYENYFRVPTKYLYPLPKDPSPPPGYERKNFILIENDLRIHKFWNNYVKWKSPQISKDFLKAFYTVITEAGLNDSIYPFNAPFSQDGKVCFIDTENYNKFHIRYDILTPNLRSEMRDYWRKLIELKGEIPENSEN